MQLFFSFLFILFTYISSCLELYIWFSFSCLNLSIYLYIQVLGMVWDCTFKTLNLITVYWILALFFKCEFIIQWYLFSKCCKERYVKQPIWAHWVFDEATSFSSDFSCETLIDDLWRAVKSLKKEWDTYIIWCT